MFVDNLYCNKKGFVFFISLVSVLSFITYYPFGTIYSFNVLAIFFVSSLISIVGFLSDFEKLGISLNKIFFIFHFLFFGIAPVVQFKFGTSFFGAQKLSVENFEKLGLVLISVQVLYLLFYSGFTFFLKKRIAKNGLKNKKKISFKLYLITSVFSVIIFLYLIKFNPEVLIFKPKYQWLKHNTNMGLIGYSFLLVFRSVPFVILVLYRLNYKKQISVKDFILLLCLLIVAFPTSITRGAVAGYYLPLLIIYFPILNKKYVFSFFFLFSFLVVFPILNYTRHYEISDIEFGSSLFNSVHFDAFQNMGNVYSQKLVTNGRQLLGSMFFFIQESRWPNRPVGTGQMLAEINNYNYANISMPLWGEGYANFGYIGIFIFVLFIALVNSFFDFLSIKIDNHFFYCVFLFLISFEFYLLRGDLFSSFKKMYSFLLALGLVYIVFYTIVLFRKEEL